jgi:peptide/nickel transport system substrate-binding protein
LFGRKRAGVAATVLAASLVLSACGGSGGGAGSSANGGSSDTLTLGAVFPVTTFAAGNISWANESPYIQAVYDTLLRATTDAEIEPWLATEWSYNEDKTVLTMKLRDDVTFTDGTKFDADVAAQNILRFREGSSPNKSFLANVTDATAVDPTTLQITLSQPDPALLHYLTQNAGVQVSPAAFDAPDAQTNPVGSGPYVLDTGATVVGSTYAFTKNEDYWAPEEQHFEQLVINVYGDPSAQVNALRGGQVNGTNLLDVTTQDQLTAAGLEMHPHELDWTGLMLMDRAGTMNPALGDVRVRQAIAHAIDREAMLEGAGRGYGTVTGQIFGENNPAYDESLNERYPYDPDQAQKLLADAGYADGLTLQMPQVSIGATTVYDLIKQYLGDVGITVEYVPTPLNNAIADILAPKYPASWFQLQQDPTAWQVANFSIAPNATFNPFKVSDPQIDTLLQTIQRDSEEEADAAAKQLNEHVVEQAWFVPFYRVQGTFAADDAIDVVQQSDNAYPYLHNITPRN